MKVLGVVEEADVTFTLLEIFNHLVLERILELIHRFSSLYATARSRRKELKILFDRGYRGLESVGDDR